MQPKAKMPPHQTIAAFHINIQAGATRHQDVTGRLQSIEHPFEVALPTPIFVNLIENHQRNTLSLTAGDQKRRILRPGSPKFNLVPVSIKSDRSLSEKHLRQRCLTTLSWARHEGDLVTRESEFFYGLGQQPLFHADQTNASHHFGQEKSSDQTNASRHFGQSRLYAALAPAWPRKQVSGSFLSKWQENGGGNRHEE